jgi:hypothetical protein
MFKAAALPALLLATSYLPPALAAKCSAVGYLENDSAGFGFGTTYSAMSGIYLYNEKGDKIGSAEPCEACVLACDDLIHIRGKGLDNLFSWGGSCNGGVITYVY